MFISYLYDFTQVFSDLIFLRSYSLFYLTEIGLPSKKKSLWTKVSILFSIRLYKLSFDLVMLVRLFVKSSYKVLRRSLNRILLCQVQ